MQEHSFEIGSLSNCAAGLNTLPLHPGRNIDEMILHAAGARKVGAVQEIQYFHRVNTLRSSSISEKDLDNNFNRFAQITVNALT
jgi:hypothetical protein